MFHSLSRDVPQLNHMRRLSLGLRTNGHEVLVIAPRLPGEDCALDGEDSIGIPYRSFPMPPKSKLFPFYPHWVGALRPRLQEKIRQVLASGSWDAAIIEGTSWWAFDPVRRICQEHGLRVAPYAIEWFDFTFRRLLGLSWIDQWLQRRFTFRKSDGLIGISRLWCELATRYGLPCTTVPAFSKYRQGELPEVVQQPHGRFRIVFTGTWLRRELPQTLVRAIELASAAGIDVELAVLGLIGHRYEEKSAMRFLAQSPAKDRIQMMGWVSDDVLQSEMAAADAFVLLRSDDRETRALFPTRLPEYLATGKPVILSDAGDLALYVQHQRSAWVIPPGDRPEALAEAIAHLWQPIHRSAGDWSGWAGKPLVQSFSQEKLSQRVVEFFSSCGCRRDPAAAEAKTAETVGAEDR